jgi:hypothetical protein
MMVAAVTINEDGDYQVNAPGVEFKAWKSSNYHSQVGDRWIVTDQKRGIINKTLLINNNQVKVFSASNHSAKLIEYQPLLLIYQGSIINIQLDPNLTKQINYKQQFLVNIKAELKDVEKRFNQLLLTQFYITPTVAQLTAVMNSYQGDDFWKEYCQIWLQQYLQAHSELQSLQQQLLQEELSCLNSIEIEQELIAKVEIY